MAEARVTIGLVVFNGERHLAAAIDSLLRQTCRDFLLVIYDNASTDGTATIAADFAARDARVRIERRSQNIGAVGNIIDAAERATSEYFCWAAHDDVREPHFLERLVALLDAHPTAALACCAVHNMLPDGTDGGVRGETASLKTSVGLSREARLRMYLGSGAGTPFYGLFRTAMLRDSLAILRNDALLDGVPVLALDIAFLADVVRRNDIAVTHESLLRFRFGGWSHRLDVYGTLRGYLNHIRFFRSSLGRAIVAPEASWLERQRLAFARDRFIWRYLTSAPMRRMSWHYIAKAMPWLPRCAARWERFRDPALRMLAARCRSLPSGSSVAIFGAGKHTVRRIAAIRAALGPASVCAILDDSALSRTIPAIDGLTVYPPAAAASLRPTAILVSSDTFEAALLERARAIAPPGTRVWTLYDRSLEAAARLSDGARESASSGEKAGRDHIAASPAAHEGAVHGG